MHVLFVRRDCLRDRRRRGRDDDRFELMQQIEQLVCDVCSGVSRNPDGSARDAGVVAPKAGGGSGGGVSSAAAAAADGVQPLRGKTLLDAAKATADALADEDITMAELNAAYETVKKVVSKPVG